LRIFRSPTVRLERSMVVSKFALISKTISPVLIIIFTLSQNARLSRSLEAVACFWKRANVT
jgi:hypothetical protein